MLANEQYISGTIGQVTREFITPAASDEHSVNMKSRTVSVVARLALLGIEKG